jgi:hypothetical protein
VWEFERRRKAIGAKQSNNNNYFKTLDLLAGNVVKFLVSGSLNGAFRQGW